MLASSNLVGALSPPQRLPLGIPVKKEKKIESARGTIQRGLIGGERSAPVGYEDKWGIRANQKTINIQNEYKMSLIFKFRRTKSKRRQITTIS